MTVYTEGVFTALLKLFGGGKFRKEMRKMEKMTEEDPQLQADIKQLSIDHAAFEEKLKTYCKRNPDSPLCDKSQKSTNVTAIRY